MIINNSINNYFTYLKTQFIKILNKLCLCVTQELQNLGFILLGERKCSWSDNLIRAFSERAVIQGTCVDNFIQICAAEAEIP